MRPEILKKIRKNLLYIVLALLVIGAVVTTILLDIQGNEPVIIYMDRSSSSDAESSEDTESDTVAESQRDESGRTAPLSEENDSCPDDSSSAGSGADEASIAEEAPAYSFPADINLVPKEQLMEIKGVGEATADSIIAFREQIGVIYNMELLLEIPGIGEEKLALLKEYLYVSPDDYRDMAQEAYAEITLPPEPEPEPEEPVITEEPSPPERQQVNVNTADAEEISQKLLIDIELAESIVGMRDLIGGYSSVYELLLAEGMSERLLNELSEYIILE